MYTEVKIKSAVGSDTGKPSVMLTVAPSSDRNDCIELFVSVPSTDDGRKSPVAQYRISELRAALDICQRHQEAAK